MYGMKGKWEREKEEIRYDISTTEGQSGSPVFIQRNGRYYVIGIHTVGRLSYNKGVILNNRVRKLIN